MCQSSFAKVTVTYESYVQCRSFGRTAMFCLNEGLTRSSQTKKGCWIVSAFWKEIVLDFDQRATSVTPAINRPTASSSSSIRRPRLVDCLFSWNRAYPCLYLYSIGQRQKVEPPRSSFTVPPFVTRTSVMIAHTLLGDSQQAERPKAFSVWNLGAVICFHFAISSLVLLPSPVTLSVWSFSAC